MAEHRQGVNATDFSISRLTLPMSDGFYAYGLIGGPTSIWPAAPLPTN